MKKLCLLLTVVFAVVVTYIPINTFAEPSITEDDALKVVNALEIMPESSDTDDISGVTRGEFITYIAKLINLQSDDNPGIYFSDVPKDSVYCNTISGLYKVNILSGCSNGKFEPDREILSEEAIKIIVKVCGYDDIAEYYGGYPNGYIKTAQDYELIDNSIGIGGKLTKNKCGKLLYKAMCAPLYKKSFGKTVKLEKSDSTLLSQYKNIVYYDGQVNAIAGASINDSYDLIKNEIIVGKEKFLLSGTLEQYSNTDILGTEVRVFYQENSNENTIVYIHNYNKTEETTITADDYLGYENYQIKYLDNKDKTKYLKIDKAASYIYNGATVSSNISELYESFNRGTITLKKINKSNSYNLVIIKSYENFIVGSYSSVNNTIGEKGNLQNTICLDDYEYINLFDNGLSVDSLYYSENDLLSIAKFGDVIEIRNNTDNDTGNIVSISSKDNNVTIKVNDKEYEIDSQYYQTIKGRLSVGQYVKIKTDMFGKVAYIDFLSSPEYTFGYLLKAVFVETDDGEVNRIELYNSNKEFLKLDVADKVKVDGIKHKGNENILKYFPNVEIRDDEYFVPMQMLRYKVNNDGKISEIDTCGNEKDSISKVGNGAITRKIYAASMGMMFDENNNQLLVNSQTLVMKVPYPSIEYEAIESEKELYFNTVKLTSYYAGTQLDCAGFTVGDSDVCPIIMSTYENENSQYSPNNAVIVNSIDEGVDNYGDLYKAIYGYTFEGVSKIYLITDNCSYRYVEGLDDISQGDIIAIHSYSKNESEYVNRVEMVLDIDNPDYDKPTSSQGWNAFVENKMAWRTARMDYPNFIMGYAVDIKDNVLYMSTNLGGDTVQMYDTTKAPIVIFDKNRNKNKFYIGSIGDINGYSSYGAKCSRVIFRKSEIAPYGLIVYK